jgi:hypothetical protein
VENSVENVADNVKNPVLTAERDCAGSIFRRGGLSRRRSGFRPSKNSSIYAAKTRQEEQLK